MVRGEASIEKLEMAGAFEGIIVYPERKSQIEQKIKRENVTAMIPVIFIVVGYILYFQLGEKNPITIVIFGLAILIGKWAEGAFGVFLFALSEALEGYSIDKAWQSIRSLMDMAPNRATIRCGNQTMEISV